MDRITRRSRLTVVALLTAICGLPVCALAFQPAAPAAPVTPTPTAPAVKAEIPLSQRLEELAQKIDRKREEQHIAGAAIAIVHNGKVVMARGFGVRDLESKTPADENTQFAIGSQTKAFTSMLVSLMADEKKLSWDDNPAKHVKGFKLFDPEANEKVTLRDLCSHQTGLPRTDLLWASGKASKPEMMERLAFAEPTHKFRTQWQYNNTMFMVAGMAAESVTGKTWHELIKTRIFAPLGMTSSNTDIDDMQKNPAKALGYAWDTEKNEYKHLPMRKVTCDGAGAINSTASDMAKWLTMLTAGGEVNGKRFVSQEMLAKMWEQQISMGGDHGYGLGWMLSKWNDKRVVDHGGNIDGFFTTCGMLPDEQIGVIFMGSATYAPLQGEVLPMVWETFFPKPAVVAGASPSVESMQEYLGNYQAEFLPGSPNCAVSIVDGKLHINVPGQMNFELLPPTDEGKWAFAMLPQQIQVKFDRADDGKVSGVTLFQSGMEFELPRMGEDGSRAYAEKPGPFTAAQLNDFAGTYHFEPTGLDWKVVVKDGKLGIDVPQQRLFMLKWPDEAGKWNVKLLPASCTFNRDESGKVTSMTWFQGGESVLKRTGDASPSTLPTLDDVVALREKSANSEKMRAFGNISVDGKVRVVNQGVTGTFKSVANTDGRVLQDISLGVFGVIRTSYDGTQAWTESVGEAFSEMTGDRLEEVRRGGSQLFSVDPRKQFDRVEVIDAREDNGVQVIVLRGITTKPEKTVTQYLDASTGLPIREESSMLIPGLGRLPVTLRYSDYRDVEGVLLPYTVTMYTDANGTFEFTVDKVTPRFKDSPELYRLTSVGAK
jgi:CubicO group peptidase (beta-lactamase class C family)